MDITDLIQEITSRTGFSKNTNPVLFDNILQLACYKTVPQMYDYMVANNEDAENVFTVFRDDIINNFMIILHGSKYFFREANKYLQFP